jgi:hypothetical protein
MFVSTFFVSSSGKPCRVISDRWLLRVTPALGRSTPKSARLLHCGVFHAGISGRSTNHHVHGRSSRHRRNFEHAIYSKAKCSAPPTETSPGSALPAECKSTNFVLNFRQMDGFPRYLSCTFSERNVPGGKPTLGAPATHRSVICLQSPSSEIGHQAALETSDWYSRH